MPCMSNNSRDCPADPPHPVAPHNPCQGCASLAAVGDPALASFPAVLRDADLADVFMG